jgi:hypothetical protein
MRMTNDQAPNDKQIPNTNDSMTQTEAFRGLEHSRFGASDLFGHSCFVICPSLCLTISVAHHR